MYRTALIIGLVAGLAAAPAAAQDTSAVRLPEVRVEAVRGTETEASAPLAVAVRTRSIDEVAFTPALDLAPVLAGLPGLSVDARGHYALGERLSVRGVGTEAPFGTRGVQVVLDGVPLTLPDGQAVLDVVEPALVRRAELVRGPAALYWGNASGGVLFLDTRPADAARPALVQVSGGSYGRRHMLAEVARPLGPARLRTYAAHARRDGYRAFSDGHRTRGGLDLTLPLARATSLRLSGAVAYQDTRHPGSLTADEVADDRRQARGWFRDNDAGKESTQAQAGLHLAAALPAGRLDATAFALTRRLDNPLPFAVIEFDRAVGGARLAWHHETGPLAWSLGGDAAVQRDDRENRAPDQASVRLLDQAETVGTLAAFGTARLALTDRLAFHAGLRADRVGFDVDDRLLATDDPETRGDQSGSRTFTAWSPSVALGYRVGATHLFAGYRSAFETPTTTELVNRPDGVSGGLNPALAPQRLHGLEAGARGLLARPDVAFDLVLFAQRLDDAIVQVGATDGRAFFGNAGTLTQRGLEAALTWTASPLVETRLTYTGLRVRYADDVVRDGVTLDLGGRRVPGVRTHTGWASLTFTPGPWWLRAELTAASDARVADIDDAVSDGYAVLDLRAGLRPFNGPLDLAPFAAVTNLFDHHYDASLIVNDGNGRFYEPAAGRALLLGLTASF